MNEIKPIGELLKIIKIKTRNPKLYERALTHSSYAYENNEKNNERLEFLGDSVIEILMSEYLFHKYKDGDEGLMTKKRAQAV
ncbi:MAG: ribonuclease III, partial [Acholeplasmataceae bacterium]|nr:ribonuclease III [Acholeplasmataceae bacterium]